MQTRIPFEQFIAAVKDGQLQIVRDYIDKYKVDINAKDKGSFTALHWAASKGHIDICRTLLDAGADINSRNNKGETALVLAAWAGQSAVAQFLLALYRPDTNIAGEDGYSALHITASCGDTGLVKALLSSGARINTKNIQGNTALHFAADKGHTATVRALLDAGADIDVRNNKGSTALIQAVDHPRVLQLLLAFNPNVNICNANNDSALHFTADSGQTAEVTALLAAGAHTNSRNIDGNTSLVLASNKGHVAIVRALLDAGADKAIVNNKGFTAEKITTNKDILLELQKDTTARSLHSFFNKLENRIEAVTVPGQRIPTHEQEEEMNQAVTLLLVGARRMIHLMLNILDDGKDVSELPNLIFAFSELMAVLSDRIVCDDQELQSYTHTLLKVAAARGHDVATHIVGSYQLQDKTMQEEIKSTFAPEGLSAQSQRFFSGRQDTSRGSVIDSGKRVAVPNISQ